MVDYPQQLAAASILRFYGDPARGLRQLYEIVLLRPQGLFEMITAGLAFLMPIEAAGKVVVSLCLMAVPLCVLLLCRRTGRPDGYALLALAVTYNHTFYLGFADNLVACPLVLLGIALADRAFDAPFGWRPWGLLAGIGLLFYTVHLEFLLVLAGAVGWLALVRRPGLRRFVLWWSSMIPGLAVGMGSLGWAHVHAAEVMTGYQQRLSAEPTQSGPWIGRLVRIPEILFGAFPNGLQVLLAAGLLVIILLLAVSRPALDLYRTRFVSLAAWVGLLFLILPEYTKGYLISDRLLPLAAMILIPGLPRPSARRVRLAAVLTALLMAVLLLQTATSFFVFAADVDGLGELLDQTEPGQSLAGLIYEPWSTAWTKPALLVHFPAYYQVLKGGRIHFSFVQFFNSPVAYRPGRNEDDAVLAEWNEWNPQRFVYPRHAAHYRYFLVRGGPEHLAAAFGPYLQGARVLKAGRWFLVERLPSK
jgi:hypothetical protein